MDFGYDEIEEMIRASAQEFLEREAGPELARGNRDASSFWQMVSELGWPGLAVSEQYGGSELGLGALGALLEQWSAHLGRGPLLESAGLIAPVLAEFADERLKIEVLPRLADGSASATFAVLEEDGRWRPESIRASAVETADGWAITGQKHFVSYGDEASYILVAARTGAGPQDISLFLVDRDANGISREPVDHASGTPTDAISFNETTIESSRKIGAEDGGWQIIEGMMLRGAAFRAVQLAGLGRQVLEATTAYAKDRKQFGVPIGSFQAVQHHLADMAVSVRRVELLARKAVWSVAEGSSGAARDVSRAKHAASELIPEVCWTAHQCHGAIGFTQEHDLHLYTRNALSWAAEFGDAAIHADRLALELGQDRATGQRS